MSVFSAHKWLPLWLLVSTSSLGAQERDRIWGEVSTVSGDRYEGFIRWDRNEGGWADILNGSKKIAKASYDLWLDARRDGERPTRTIELMGYRITWDEEDPDFPSTSASGIRFGHLAGMSVVDRDRVAITLRSGHWLELSGGSTDIGMSIRELQVEDPDRGTVDLEWDELEQIVFSAAPSGVQAESPRLYGTVTDASGRAFTGYVSWDLDEIFGSDVLDGEDEDRDDREIEFKDIRALEKTEDGTRVTLTSGEVLHLSGTNDVDRGHRGVQISDPDLGMVEVEWGEFLGLRLFERPAAGGYDAYDGGHRLIGTVTTESGEDIRGRVRWDTDEHWSWELLDGHSEAVVLLIEFGRIQSIASADSLGTRVTLLDGRTFLLDDRADLDEQRGIFVEPLDEDDRPWVFIPWTGFRSVRFEHPEETSAEVGGGLDARGSSGTEQEP